MHTLGRPASSVRFGLGKPQLWNLGLTGKF